MGSPALAPENPLLGLDDETLLGKLRDPLARMLREQIDADAESEKIAQLRQLKRNHLYFEGQQNLVPAWVSPGVADFVNAPTTRNDQSNSSYYDYSVNIIWGHGEKAIAVLGKTPNLKAVADDPANETSLSKVKKAQGIYRYLSNVGKWDTLTKNIAEGFWKFGEQYIHVDYRADEARYGTVHEPIFEQREVPLTEGGYDCQICGERTPGDLANVPPACVSCGSPLSEANYTPPETVPVPHLVGEIPYPNGCVEARLYSAMEVTVPRGATCIEDCGYLVLDLEEPLPNLHDKYPNLRKLRQQKNNTSTSPVKEEGSDAREIVTSFTGQRYHRKGHARESRYWLRPTYYTLIVPDREQSDPNDSPFVQALKEKYPDGLLVSCVDGVPVALKKERMDEHWLVMKPTVSKTLQCDAICTPLIPVQDMVNNCHNLAEHTFMTAIPATIMSQEVVDRKSIEGKPPSPADIIWARAGIGGGVKEHIASLPVAEFSSQMLPWMQGLMETGSEIVGVTRAIFGGAGPTKTAEEARIQKNAALMQLSIPYDNIRAGECELANLSVRLLMKMGIGLVEAPADSKVFGSRSTKVQLSPDDVDGWHFEADPGMPASFAEERDRLTQTLEQSPQVAHMAAMDHPFNIERFQDYVGIADWYNPVEMTKAKVFKRLQVLLSQPPIQSPPPPMVHPGMPPPPPMPPRPPVPPDPWDDHATVAQLLSCWMNSDEGMEEQQSNPNFQSVVAYWQATQQMMAPPPGPPPGDDGGDKPKGPKKPPPGGPPPDGGDVPPPPAPGGMQQIAPPAN